MICVDNINKSKGETYEEEPIMVTIALAEYRSLVMENATLVIENMRANDEINRLCKENKRLLNGGSDR